MTYRKGNGMKIKTPIGGAVAVLILLWTVLGLFSTNDIAIHDETKIEISSIADDCIYWIVAITGSGSFISLGDVCLIIVDPDSTILLPPTPLTAFNSSGELYYHFVRFNDGNDTGQLNVGDYFQFNRTMYWGSVFRLTDSGSTSMYCEVTIDDADDYFAVQYFLVNYGPPGLSYSGSPMILLIFSIAAAAILIGTAVMVRKFKFEEEKRKQIRRLVAAVMGLMIVLFIAATLYTMVLYY